MPVALIIIYNHQYNENIDILEKLYADRFSSIYHIVPFYSGEKANVISVYENSFYFQGYVAQSFKFFYKDQFKHYFFIGDDLILNPEVNQFNYKHHLRLTNKSSFLPEILNFHDGMNFWPRIKEAFVYKLKAIGVEAENQLPSITDALHKFSSFNIGFKSLRYTQIYRRPKFLLGFRSLIKNIRYFKYELNQVFFRRDFNLSYPLVGGYSDIFVVSSSSIRNFCHYCGVFAATDLHVEIAIPTAMVLAAEKIVTEKDLILQGKALWTQEDLKILDKYNFDLNQLLNNFPKDNLYIHPIKLSKWKTT
jgi:hypothetical protein